MNKREMKMVELWNKNKEQDLSGFTTKQLIDRTRLQGYLYSEIWRRFERRMRSKVLS